MDWDILIVGALLSLTIYLFTYQRPKSPIVTDIIYYHIKSCGGIHLFEAEIDSYGILRDRIWAIFDKDKKVVTQRENPALMKLQPRFTFDGSSQPTELVLTYPEHGEFKLDLTASTDYEEFPADVWSRIGIAKSEGPNVAEWLRSVFKEDYILAKIHERGLEKKTGNPVNFNDGCHLLVVSEESYAELYKQLPNYKRDQVSMMTFRPNIVVKNCKVFEEDTWDRFTINNVEFHSHKPCPRCRLTTINPRTLEFDKNFEPVTTIRKIHGVGVKAMFGQLAWCKSQGKIHVKDTIKILKRKEFPN
jgi:uncharacterized protein YcbX